MTSTNVSYPYNEYMEPSHTYQSFCPLMIENGEKVGVSFHDLSEDYYKDNDIKSEYYLESMPDNEMDEELEINVNMTNPLLNQNEDTYQGFFMGLQWGKYKYM